MKSNTNELRKQLNAILKNIDNTAKVYYHNTPQPAPKPYIVFDVQTLGYEEGKTSCTLEVNCVAATQAEVQNLADKVQDTFESKILNANKLLFYSFRGARRSVDEEDKLIERIRLMIDLYVYSREEN